MPDPRLYPVDAIVDTFATVSGVSSEVVAENDNRQTLVLTNDSDLVMYLGFGHAAVVGSGAPLNPGRAGVYNMDGLNLFLGAIHAISTGDAQDADNLAISEGSRTK